jgi:hypothetical protein
VRAHRLCIVEGWGHKSIGCSLEGTSPESRCAGHGSRLLARPPPRRLSTKRLKPQYAGCKWQDYTRPFLKALGACRLPVCAGSIEAALLGLPGNVSLDGIESVKVPHGRLQPSAAFHDDIRGIRCKHPDMEAFAMRPVGYSLADRRRCNDPGDRFDFFGRITRGGSIDMSE